MTKTPPETPAPALTDQAFNPWRCPASDDAQRLCVYIHKTVEAYEKVHALRQRKRKPADQDVFQRSIAALICDLLRYDVIYCKSGRGKSTVNAKEGLHTSLSNRHLGAKTPSRRSPVMSKALPDIIKRLASCGFLTLDKGYQGCDAFGIPSRQTVLRPTRLLIDLATGRKAAETGESFKITGLEDFKTDNTGREAVVLRLPKEKRGQKESGPVVAYANTRQTRKLEEEMRTINDWLDQAPIAYGLLSAGDMGTPPCRLIDPQDRFLTRHLNNNDFGSGGRLFGGFWQPMPQADRLKHITIAGEKVCSLDYGQMCPRILYGLAGKEPPSGDCYLLTGYYLYRETVKKVFNAAVFMDAMPSRFPPDTRDNTPKHVSFLEICTALLKTHSAIKDYLFTDSKIGYKVQNIESNIMVDLLLTLKDKGLPAALPIHDALVVPVSFSDTAKLAMEDIFYKHTGLKTLLKIETSEMDNTVDQWLIR